MCQGLDTIKGAEETLKQVIKNGRSFVNVLTMKD